MRRKLKNPIISVHNSPRKIVSNLPLILSHCASRAPHLKNKRTSPHFATPPPPLPAKKSHGESIYPLSSVSPVLKLSLSRECRKSSSVPRGALPHRFKNNPRALHCDGRSFFLSFSLLRVLVSFSPLFFFRCPFTAHSACLRFSPTVARSLLCYTIYYDNPAINATLIPGEIFDGPRSFSREQLARGLINPETEF